MKIDQTLTPASLLRSLDRLFEASAAKIRALDRRWDPAMGAPVFTQRGQYTTRGWTEWTQGFQYGSALLQYEATGEAEFLAIARRGIQEVMASHVSNVAVHDHGFNNVSTYGNLRRLILEGRADEASGELGACELALKVSGAIQSARWTSIADGGFIYSFNGPHSLFVDTIRSLRSLALAHELGHALMAEGDRRVSLLDRLIQHAAATARYNVYYGEGRDVYDVPGRVAHEAIFNVVDGAFRCPCTQQGYSPFTTWTRGLAWAILGFAELLEYTAMLHDGALDQLGGREAVLSMLERAARVTSDFYVDETPADGIPYWDTGAPGLVLLGDYRSRPADPFNAREPVDSSAAAIAAQGLLRLGRHLSLKRNPDGERYWQAGLTVAHSLLGDPYLSSDSRHEGLLLHVVYHRPNGWDYVPPSARVPFGESAMWGDYHLRELGLLLRRESRGESYLTFFGPSAHLDE
jgi:unsaturated chondroitin disaccharide hydrolase